MILFKNAELILETLSLVATSDNSNQICTLEFAEMEYSVDENSGYSYKPNQNRVTVSLDHADLDEIIAILQDASNHLKKEV